MSAPVRPTLDATPDDRPAPPFDPKVVDALLTQLDKTVRAVQQYPANNPVYRKSMELMRAAFAPVWAEAESLTLQVSDTAFIWFGVPVHVQEEKAGDSLPWTLYKDGLRELTITPGFEVQELDRFLAVIPRVRKALPLDDDLLTLLWEEEFEHLAYRHVQLATDGVPIDTAATPGKWPVMPGREVKHPLDAIDVARHDQEQQGAGAAGGGGWRRGADRRASGRRGQHGRLRLGALFPRRGRSPLMLSRPTVIIVSDDLGNVKHPGEIVNLADTDEAGNFRRTIIKTADPERYGIRVGDQVRHAMFGNSPPD